MFGASPNVLTGITPLCTLPSASKLDAVQFPVGSPTPAVSAPLNPVAMESMVDVSLADKDTVTLALVLVTLSTLPLRMLASISLDVLSALYWIP